MGNETQNLEESARAPRNHYARAGHGPVRIFAQVWVAVFLASLSTFFLLMVLSAKVFSESASPLAANSVVLTQWLPAILALPLIRSATRRFSPRDLLFGTEFISAAVIPLIAIVYGAFYAMIALLLVKGGMDSLSKVARALAVKRYFSGRELDKAASYYNTAMLAGSGVGALFGALLLNVLSLASILAICSLCHIVAGCLYILLPRGHEDKQTSASAPVPISKLNPRLQAGFFYFIAAVALYQGFQNVARSAFPTEQLGMSEAGIALIQTITSFAYILGALFAARISVAENRYDRVGPGVHIFALTMLIPLPLVTEVSYGLILYGGFAFAFEVAFAVHMRFLIVASPKEQLSNIVASANAFALAAMVAVAFLGSFAVERFGLFWVTCAFLLLATSVPFVIKLLVRSPK
ncbi:MFS transporter [uncultured Tateyamaria sp.]|uniref:MFS transporter n=1 Tax=uncultured Tateyamaria sp. TaxID=455651 RepID=UPI002628AFD5|nr:MFS transporter [uncultured Tateyamaria sp.]